MARERILIIEDEGAYRAIRGARPDLRRFSRHGCAPTAKRASISQGTIRLIS